MNSPSPCPARDPTYPYQGCCLCHNLCQNTEQNWFTNSVLPAGGLPPKEGTISLCSTLEHLPTSNRSPSPNLPRLQPPPPPQMHQRNQPALRRFLVISLALRFGRLVLAGHSSFDDNKRREFAFHAHADRLAVGRAAGQRFAVEIAQVQQAIRSPFWRNPPVSTVTSGFFSQLKIARLAR